VTGYSHYMTNLVPEKRLDKNGRLVTKHVRSTQLQDHDKQFPQPTTTSSKQTKEEKELEKRIRRLNDRVFYSFDRSKFSIKANKKLAPFFLDSYHPGCSSNDLYDLLEHLTLSDTIVLASAPMKVTQLRRFVKTHDYQDHLVDNSELVSELRARGIKAQTYFELAANENRPAKSQNALLDAAECQELYPVQLFRSSYEPCMLYPQYLLEEQINLSDIKDLGLELCAGTTHFGRVLLMLKKSGAQCTAKDISEVLDRTAAADDQLADWSYRRDDIVGDRAILAVGLGTGFAESVVNPVPMRIVYEFCLDKKLNLEDSTSFCLYMNEILGSEGVIEEDWYQLSQSFTFEMWQNDVPLGLVKEALQANMTPQQVLAIHREKIAPSVSTGWL